MSRISDSTFRSEKNYVAVRMQQGVPLVDADWNEMNDIIRHEIYDGLKQIFPNGDFVSGDSLRVSYDETNERIEVEPGSVIIRGFPIHLREKISYDQRLRDSYRYLVYLDIWEREVDSDDDADLSNPEIGIETCVRLKRQIDIKVKDQRHGRPYLPPEPQDHIYVELARLRKRSFHSRETTVEVEDVRLGTHEISLFPAFFSVANNIENSWSITNSSLRKNLYPIPPGFPIEMQLYRYKYFAVKSPYKQASGILPLNLPQGARILELKIQGFTQGHISFSIYRSNSTDPANLDLSSGDTSGDELFDQPIELEPPSGERYLVFPRRDYPLKQGEECVVDNNKYLYILYARAAEPEERSYVAEIHGISITYRP